MVGRLSAVKKPFRYSTATAVILLATGFTSLINLLYGVLVGRALGPERFGEYASLIVLSGVISTAAGGLQATTAREVAREQGGSIGRDSWVSRALVISLIVMAVLLAFAPLLETALSSDFWSIVPVAATAPAAALLAVGVGRMIGKEKIIAWQMTGVALSLVKFALGVGIGWLLVSIHAFLWGSTGAALIVGVAALFVTRRTALSHIQLRDPLIWQTTGLVVALWLALQSDIIFARMSLEGQQAGSYSAAAGLSKAVVVVLALAGTVVLPRVSRQWTRGHVQRRFLLGLNALMMAVASSLAVLLWIFGDAIISVVFGDRFVMGSGLLGLCMFASVAWVGATAMVNAWMGTNALRTPLIVVAGILALQLASYALFVSNVLTLVLSYTLAGLVINLAVSLIVISSSRGRVGHNLATRQELGSTGESR